MFCQKICIYQLFFVLLQLEMKEKENIGALFDRIARRYDRFNHLLSMGIDKCWRRRVVRGMKSYGSVLDVAVGTGDLAIEMLRRGKAQQVTGIDLSDEMMRIAQHKALRANVNNRLTLQHANAQAMPFANDTFDAVTCSFGVRNFANLTEGLNEMRRVLRPGGKLIILEFSYPVSGPLRMGYDLYFGHLMPLIGQMLIGDRKPFLYFRESVRNFIWGEELCCKLREAGFENVTFEPLSFSIAMNYQANKPIA